MKNFLVFFFSASLLLLLGAYFIFQPKSACALGGGPGGNPGVCQLGSRCGPTNLVLGYCAAGCAGAQSSGNFDTSTYNDQCATTSTNICFNPVKTCGAQPNDTGLCVFTPYNQLGFSPGTPDCQNLKHLSQYDNSCTATVTNGSVVKGICCSTQGSAGVTPTPPPITDCEALYNGFCSDTGCSNIPSGYPNEQYHSIGNSPCGIRGGTCCASTQCAQTNTSQNCFLGQKGMPYCCDSNAQCTSSGGKDNLTCQICSTIAGSTCTTNANCCRTSLLVCNSGSCQQCVSEGLSGCSNQGGNCCQPRDKCTVDGKCQPPATLSCQDDTNCFPGQKCIANTCTDTVSPPPGTVRNPCPNNSCDTAIGTINVGSGGDFVRALFQIILSISGGIALLLIIYAGYNLTLSQGNPEKVQGAKETLTSAIVGLVFIILSLTVLQVIGVDILKLPGFHK